MGTSSSLHVKSPIKSAMLYCSYDGHPDRVTIAMLSSIASVGWGALISAFDRASVLSADEQKDAAENEDELDQIERLARQIALDGYAEAARARHCVAYGLADGVFDFSLYACKHPYMGIANLFAPTILDASDWAGETGDYVLDLEHKRFGVSINRPQHLNDAESYPDYFWIDVSHLDHVSDPEGFSGALQEWFNDQNNYEEFHQVQNGFDGEDDQTSRQDYLNKIFDLQKKIENLMVDQSLWPSSQKNNEAGGIQSAQQIISNSFENTHDYEKKSRNDTVSINLISHVDDQFGLGLAHLWLTRLSQEVADFNIEVSVAADPSDSNQAMLVVNEWDQDPSKALRQKCATSQLINAMVKSDSFGLMCREFSSGGVCEYGANFTSVSSGDTSIEELVKKKVPGRDEVLRRAQSANDPDLALMVLAALDHEAWVLLPEDLRQEALSSPHLPAVLNASVTVLEKSFPGLAAHWLSEFDPEVQQAYHQGVGFALASLVFGPKSPQVKAPRPH